MIEGPPAVVWQRFDSFVPGVYSAFIVRLISALHEEEITSWWRSIARNANVGGDPNSQHLLALAVDIRSNRPTSTVQSLRRAGLVAVDEGDHVHAQLFQRNVIAPFVQAFAV